MNNRTQPYYNNSLAIRQEIQRFESVHPSIYAIYDLLEVIPDPLLAQQIREHVVCIEGEWCAFGGEQTSNQRARPRAVSGAATKKGFDGMLGAGLPR
ncbi:hypothetical protein MRX96_002112 [Rhipicephalus microplus]|uniref:Centaurin-gamma-1A n=1 Tax=Rhipicephalus microplus TaxID=6941 RepID=A0A9J6DRF3_RHIMP|nr:hypothetical protein HPB51_025472 [Rhipicephalus microplus]